MVLPENIIFLKITNFAIPTNKQQHVNAVWWYERTYLKRKSKTESGHFILLPRWHVDYSVVGINWTTRLSDGCWNNVEQMLKWIERDVDIELVSRLNRHCWGICCHLRSSSLILLRYTLSQPLNVPSPAVRLNNLVQDRQSRSSIWFVFSSD